MGHGDSHKTYFLQVKQDKVDEDNRKSESMQVEFATYTTNLEDKTEKLNEESHGFYAIPSTK
jgi:hypothetical protein